MNLRYCLSNYFLNSLFSFVKEFSRRASSVKLSKIFYTITSVEYRNYFQNFSLKFKIDTYKINKE